MPSIRTTSLTLGMLTLIGLNGSFALAHEDCIDVPTAARNLSRATQRLVDDLAIEFHGPECVLEAAQDLSDDARHLRAVIARQLPKDHVCADFKDTVQDFRTLTRHLGGSRLPACLERDMLAVKGALLVLGQSLEGHAPSFGDEMDDDHHHGRPDFQAPVGRIVPRPPVTRPVVVPAPMPRPYYGGPQGAGFGVKLGKVQLNFYSR